MNTKLRRINPIEDEDLATSKARRILANTSLVGKLANSIEFLEYLHELKVKKDNPFWLIGDEAYNIQLIQKRLLGEPVDLYAWRYYRLFREHGKYHPNNSCKWRED